MSYAHILVDHGLVTTITMNRTGRHNAIDTAAGDEFVAAFTPAGRWPEVKVIVLAGAGAGASFCSGGDRAEGAGGQIPDFPWKTRITARISNRSRFIGTGISNCFRSSGGCRSS